jgi:cytochrome c oxidase assembly factor CtaG
VNRGWHALEHLSFLAAGLAFWAGILRAGPRRRMHQAHAMILVIGSMILTGWLAAALTFGNLIYPIYAARGAIFHIDALADQQLAGALMWVPMSLLAMTTFGVLFVGWLRDLDRRFARRPPAVIEK